MAKQSKNQSKTHWRGMLRALKKSGLGVAAFCRQKGLSPASLYTDVKSGSQPPAVSG